MTRDNIAIGSKFIVEGAAFNPQVKPLDIGDLLVIFEMATKATGKDGQVSVEAELLQRMAKELILSKSSASTTVGAGRSYGAFHGVRSDDREMKPMPGHAYAITTRPYAF